ncbi:M18 family aminopeptidase [Brevibacterium sp. 5221]|uniref:M18 family aminopeptidase n=1 Tax=Brevibacterium rongguiense TaxID=2695267 RepID=A0A6N9HA12_9MICO|nr:MULTISPECIES: M18 family aminopeptidase [Brevibacterium]MYM20611.1 M18 family aminopeptidase [Brevibacterium rongguiense]WAL39359.1 M18 family aminopeptidase [Brevibacterium sp. BRM-1]
MDTPQPTAQPPAPDAAAQDLAGFVAAAPTSFHAAAEVACRLSAAGYRELAEGQRWELAPGDRCVIVRDGAAIAFAVPAEPLPAPTLRVLGAHTDSPALKLGPSADFASAGARQIDVEVYGGPLLNSWLDRELCLAGRLVLADGSRALVRTGPIARIPQLAIHLDRQVNDGLALDRQRHLPPVIGLQVPGEDADGVMDLLARAAGVDADRIVGHDVYTIPAQPPEAFGARREFLAAPRLDNLTSVHAGTAAMERVDPAGLDAIAVFAAFDHEEVGSQTRSGAGGPFLADVCERILLALGADRADVLAALSGSVCLSADAGHAVHPNYPERHDPVVRPVLGRGPLLKLNAQQRYATDAVGAGAWAAACARAGVEYQEFVSHNDVPCGSTIGPITAARLGMTTVDVGIALWSMHSAREMCASADVAALNAALAAFVQG